MSRFAFSQAEKRGGPLKRMIFSIGFFVLLFLFFLYATGSLSKGNTSRQKESLAKAINRNIIYHYSSTGTYPGSLEQIEKEYGLIYDKSLFYVDYKVRGQNIMPDVTIIEKVPSE